ncbi:MAG: phosphate ABC transporter permease subunit PstC [Ktedonobacterales bacterium]
MVLIIVAIFLFVGANAYQTFTQDHITLAQFFLGQQWSPDDGVVGAAKIIVATFSVTVAAVLLSVPFSVGIALFITQVAPPWMQRAMQPVLELFTGLPSIIYGFLALVLLVPLLAQVENAIADALGHTHTYYYNGAGFIPAALVLAVMIMPTIASLSVDALRAVPNEIREGSLALGATRWQTMARTLVPAAVPGILTGVILGTGRAIGETLAVAFVIGGNPNNWPFTLGKTFPYLGLNPIRTITVQLLFDFQEATPRSLNYHAIWTLALVLLVISLLLVAASRAIAARRVYA